MHYMEDEILFHVCTFYGLIMSKFYLVDDARMCQIMNGVACLVFINFNFNCLLKFECSLKSRFSYCSIVVFVVLCSRGRHIIWGRPKGPLLLSYGSYEKENP